MKKMLISPHGFASNTSTYNRIIPIRNNSRIVSRGKVIDQKKYLPEVFYDENIIIELEKLKLSVLEEIKKLENDLVDLDNMQKNDSPIFLRVKEKIELDTKILNNNIIDIDKKIQIQSEINIRLKEEYERKSQAEKDRLEAIKRLEEQKREEEERRKEKLRILQDKKDNALIPFKIFQTWHSINLPKGMKEAIIKITKNNPERIRKYGW